MLRPQRRKLTADSDANDVPEPEAKRSTSHAGEEQNFAESTAEQSTCAPDIHFLETHTTAGLINIALANVQKRMDQSYNVNGQLGGQNTVSTHRILSVLATQVVVELHVDDEHGDEGACPDGLPGN